jgi:hypothetical protein
MLSYERSNLIVQVTQAKFVTCPMRLPRCARNDILVNYWYLPIFSNIIPYLHHSPPVSR